MNRQPVARTCFVGPRVVSDGQGKAADLMNRSTLHRFGQSGARGYGGVERKRGGWCQWRSCARSFCIRSHILLRSEMSRPGGNPPADVTHRIRRGRRVGRPPACRNSLRKARSTMSRKVVLISNAFRLASSSRSSGSSTVIFIQVPLFPYFWGSQQAPYGNTSNAATFRGR